MRIPRPIRLWAHGWNAPGKGIHFQASWASIDNSPFAGNSTSWSAQALLCRSFLKRCSAQIQLRNETLARAKIRLAKGATLADTLAETRELFDSVTLELIRAGEETGTLEQTLKRRTEQLEQLRKIALRTLVAFLYPAYLASGCHLP